LARHLSADEAGAAFEHGEDADEVVAAFEDKRVFLEIIADGLHVHPEVVHLAFRSAPGRVVLIFRREDHMPILS